MRRFASHIQNLFKPNTALGHQLEPLLGFFPKQIVFYQLAFTHSSNDAVGTNNERLEYLGDAILGAVVAEYLFKKYPTQGEGFLTEMRSRMVRRETLNEVALKMGLNKLIHFNKNDRGLRQSNIYGNALEALVGAVYLDLGYNGTRRFILKQMIKNYMDVADLEANDKNFKNKLLQWSQTHNKKVVFDLVAEKREGARRIFTVAILIDDKEEGRGHGFTKKAAGQDAASKTLSKLGIAEPEA